MIKQENIIINKIILEEKDLVICQNIANNTLNTWQTNRKKEDILKDTVLGKLAEKSLKNYLINSNNKNNYAFYDDFRNDDFKNHNIIDFLFSNDINKLNNCIEYIKKNYRTNNDKKIILNYVKLKQQEFQKD